MFLTFLRRVGLKNDGSTADHARIIAQLSRCRYLSLIVLLTLVPACDRVADSGAPGEVATPAPRNEIVITQHPRQTMSGRAIKPHPAVQVFGRWGRPASGVAVRVTPSPGQFEPTSVTEVMTDAEGRAVFDNLFIAQADAIYRLQFSAEGYEPVTSKQFNIVFGPPRKMSLLSQPMNSVAGQPLEGGVAILLTDAAGNPVPNVNVRVSPQPEGVVISSGETISATDNRGIAVFPELVIEEPTSLCQLVFECLAAGVNPVTSETFAVERTR